MKLSRLLPALCLAGSILCSPALRAQSFIWTGNSTTDGSITDATNWQSGVPGGVSGTEDVFFGDITGTRISVLIPTSTLRHITLNGSARPNYSFLSNGSAQVLTLTGNVTMQDGPSAMSFGDLGFSLSSGSHTVEITAGAAGLSLAGPTTGTGSLVKTGDGQLTLTGANTYTGGTTVTAGTLALTTGTINHAAVDTVVGNPTGTATFTIDGGADVDNARLRIGVAAGSTGYVSVSGAGTTLDNTTYLYVGDAGSGTLDISDSATVTSANTSVGNNIGGTGQLNVSDTGSTLTNSANLYVGSAGNGSLHIASGADVVNVIGSIGNNPGGIGAVTVTGAGSTWTNSGTLFVGNQGTGSLDIALGGAVTSASGILGETGGVTGTAKIHGSGSSWTVTGPNLYVGNGANGILYLYDQAQINVGAGTGTLHLAHSSGGAGILKIGTDGTSSFAGGILNAAAVTTGSGNSGELRFATTATVASPYYFTKNGLAGGTGLEITGATQVINTSGYTVLNGVSSYTGATLITGGTLVAANDDALGNSAVTLNGGTLVVKNSYVYNTLTLTAGRLAGNGYVPNATIGANVVFAPGDLSAAFPSIGSFGLDHLELASGGGMEWNLQNPNTTAGAGWDVVNIFTSATLDITATSANKFTLKLISLNSGGSVGAATGFNLGQAYSWLMFDTDNMQGFDPAKFALDTSLFTSNAGLGTFSLSATGNDLYLNFTPVPEPSTYAFLALGLGFIGLTVWRQRRA